MPTPAEDMLEVDYEDNDEVTSDLRIIDDDEIFNPSSQAEKSGTFSVLYYERSSGCPAVCMDMQTMCKCAACHWWSQPAPFMVADVFQNLHIAIRLTTSSLTGGAYRVTAVAVKVINVPSMRSAY